MRGRVALLIAAACGGCGDDPPPGLPGTLPPPCPLASRFFQIDDVSFPDTVDGYTRIAFDLDFVDEVDNRLGEAHWYFSQAVAIPSAERVRGLETPWLVEVAECEEETLDHARVWLHEGAPVAGMPVAGAIPSVGKRAGAFVTAERGVAIAPLAALFELDAAETGAWLDARGTAFRLEPGAAELAGTMGFGIEARDGQAALAGPFARLYTAILALDPDCAPASGLCDDVLSAIALAFDADGDRVITAEELMAEFPDRIGQQYLVADTDLLDGGDYWPNHDGIDDSLSIAFSFHAVEVDVAPPP